MTVRQRLVAQFRQPRGLPGQLAGLVMAMRPSNRARNRWTVELLDLQPGDRLLEIGFGPGLAIAVNRLPLKPVGAIGVIATHD